MAMISSPAAGDAIVIWGLQRNHPAAHELKVKANRLADIQLRSCVSVADPVLWPSCRVGQSKHIISQQASL